MSAHQVGLQRQRAQQHRHGFLRPQLVAQHAGMLQHGARHGMAAGFQQFKGLGGLCIPVQAPQAFAQHLRPWADQPPKVLNQLRQLQAEMTRASIARCLSLGRLSPEQAKDLQTELGIEGPLPQPSSRP
jgi:hypothetical protein